MSSTPSTVARARRLPRIVATVAALAVAAGALVGMAEPAAAAAVYTGSAPAGTTLEPGDSVTSPNGQFRLVMQGDGNLVEYGIGNAVLWASNTPGQSGAVAVIGRNRALDLMRNGKRVARWASAGTTQSTRFDVRGDGTMALFAGSSAIVNWTSYQDRVPAGNVILPGTTLRADQSNARTLTMMGNGMLVQRLNGAVAWLTTTTIRNYNAYASVQKDGNLVVYSAQGKALWATNTSRAGGGQLLVQVDNNVVLYGKSDTRSWSTRPVSGLLWPVASTKISGKYGDDRGAGHVPRYHQGADAAVGTGTPVYASATGKVTSAVANNPTFGNYVVVTYGMTTVLTAHLSVIQVKQGQIVSARTQIAKSGNTGQSTGPHVHVEVRQGGTLVDPLKVLHFR
ncbi:murein DD-endopeptidase MepM/ murein hydrolase activator NlpD [Curtobacterium pusillum]|uniref:Murein DD-endopeptidase MepM/ murein hydrolase activator NlpD n=1 Tax=Curtobacterium pusillum TaxID=69373 RepID=A0AAW3T3M8_9MICO|nr:peptidoglycan DD-metalloendopeptidase family protein [Curtobacterium pusillum]MBA8989555.1 murein DD-endopeptidase MepM/ murein hydrolase activator NlpD [Curtobacterium pusillum]